MGDNEGGEEGEWEDVSPERFLPSDGNPTLLLPCVADRNRPSLPRNAGNGIAARPTATPAAAASGSGGGMG